jgi:hypothetical protein
VSKDDFQKVLDGLLRQGQSASHSHSGSVTSILSKLLAATKTSTAKPMASLRGLLPAVQKVHTDSSGRTSDTSGGGSARDFVPVSGGSASSTATSAAGGSFDAGSFAIQFQKAADGGGKTVAGATAAQALRILAKRAAAPKSTGNPISNILSKIPGVSLAISPIISGIIGLFGGHNNTLPALTPFVLPSSVRLDAAIGPKDQFLPASHGANGLPKLNGVAAVTQSNASAQQTSAQQINAQQINVAPPLDSRFFLDHSDQIALAVKDAMLHSSSLNDVITDL